MDLQLLADRYLLQEEVGFGATARVFRAFDLSSGEPVAIKAMAADAAEAANHEYTAMQLMFGTPNVANVRDAFVEGNKCYLVLKYMPNGTLYQRIKPCAESSVASLYDLQRWFRQLVGAVEAFHQRCLIHGDIKPENCLIDEQENLVLHDLGTTAAVGHVHSGRLIPGTEYYMAPELLQRAPCAPEQDVWSLGIVLHAILLSDLPWRRADPSDPAFAAYLKSGRLALGPRASLLSHELRELLGRMLEPEPRHRASLLQVALFLDAGVPWFEHETSRALVNKPSPIPIHLNPAHCVRGLVL